MRTSRSLWHGCRPQRDYAPAGLLFKNFRSISYWVRPDAVGSFRNLWAIRMTSNCAKITICPHKIVGYHGSFDFDWLDWEHVLKLLIASPIKNGLLTVEECQAGTYAWVFCSATSEAQCLEHEDVKFVAYRMCSQYACRDLTGVYFISNGRGSVKIGLSRGRMHERLTSLQLNNPDTLTIIAVIPDACPDALETQLHRTFKDRRIRNEWFRFSDEEARKIAEENGGYCLSEYSVDTK